MTLTGRATPWLAVSMSLAMLPAAVVLGGCMTRTAGHHVARSHLVTARPTGAGHEAPAAEGAVARPVPTNTVRYPTPIRATGLIRDVPATAGLPSGFVLGTVTRDLGAFDRAIHTRAGLRVMFVLMGSSNFPGPAIIENAKLGAETVIEMQPKHVTLDQITAGAEDSWLQNTFAPDVVALSRAVMVSFAPEMNGQWYSWGHGSVTPAQFVQAWQHIHAVLAATPAAPYISWLWQPSAIHFTTPSPKPYWPGTGYVDDVGLDGYYIFPTDNFTTIFGKTIKLVRSLTTVPIIIGETSVGPLTARQSADIEDLFGGIRRYNLRGLVWFNVPQNRGIYHQDWRLQDHPVALDTFITLLAAEPR